MSHYARGLLLAGVLLFAACAEQEQDVGETEEGELTLGRSEVQEVVERGVDPGDRMLVFEGFSGSVQLEGTGTQQVAELEFTKRARGQNDEEARERLDEIEIDETGGEEEYVYRLSTDDPNRTSVDVTGQVPQGMRLRIQLENGSVILSGIDGPIQVQSSNGDIRIAEAGEDVRAETRNGRVEAGLRRLPQNATVHLQTRNGDLQVALPSGASAQVEARTSAGRILLEGLNFKSRRLGVEGAGANFSGQLGDGNAQVELQTENGSIVLREGALPELPADTLEGDPSDLLPTRPVVPSDTLERDTLESDTLESDTLESDTTDTIQVDLDRTTSL